MHTPSDIGITFVKVDHPTGVLNKAKKTSLFLELTNYRHYSNAIFWTGLNGETSVRAHP